MKEDFIEEFDMKKKIYEIVNETNIEILNYQFSFL